MTIGPYYCFKLIPWNKTLDGTFEPSTYQGGFSHQQKSPPEIVDGITFSRDGQFTLLADGQSSSPTKGRYKVSGAALTLVMPSKEERAYTLHLFADHGQPPKAVLIDGRPFFAKTN
ncbi:MAG: hypothetical protein H7145_04425 [Akkermansiaceae bacterium]|nr:hypothetical protein [Armatimonadota bacterium]